MAKLCIFLDHDILVRHFVLSGVLSPLKSQHDLVFVCPENHKRFQIDLSVFGQHSVRTIPVSTERAYLYRRLYHATLLMRMRGMATSHRRAMRRVWRSLLGRRAYWESWFYSWPVTYQFYYARMLTKIGENLALHDLLAEERPDVIIHPTTLEGLFVSDLVRWGDHRETPTVFIMNSWDNPATKAMMVGYPSRLLVWGEQTKQHAIGHLRVPTERVVSVGVAQFDLYRQPPKETPLAYRTRLGVPHGHKLFLYAGSSKGLDETRHLIRLEEAVERGELKDCTVLYRPHPWRAYPQGEEDFFSRNWKHVILEPCMEACYRRYRQSGAMPVDLAKYEDTHVTLNAVDAVISPLSTILLEAAMHGRPVGVYLPDEDMKSNHHLSTVASMIHFQEFFDRVDCMKCEHPDQLVEVCRQLLKKTDEPGLGEKLKAQCRYFVEPSDAPYAQRLDDVIQSLLSSPIPTAKL